MLSLSPRVFVISYQVKPVLHVARIEPKQKANVINECDWLVDVVSVRRQPIKSVEPLFTQQCFIIVFQGLNIKEALTAIQKISEQFL